MVGGSEVRNVTLSLGGGVRCSILTSVGGSEVAFANAWGGQMLTLAAYRKFSDPPTR